MSAKKGLLWVLYVVLAFFAEIRWIVWVAWLYIGIGIVGAEHWWLWPAGFVALAFVDAALRGLLNGPLDPKRLSPNGNFAE